LKCRNDPTTPDWASGGFCAGSWVQDLNPREPLLPEISRGPRGASRCPCRASYHTHTIAPPCLLVPGLRIPTMAHAQHSLTIATTVRLCPLSVTVRIPASHHSFSNRPQRHATIMSDSRAPLRAAWNSSTSHRCAECTALWTTSSNAPSHQHTRQSTRDLCCRSFRKPTQCMDGTVPTSSCRNLRWRTPCNILHYTPKLLPQPQVSSALGLLNEKPPPISSLL